MRFDVFDEPLASKGFTNEPGRCPTCRAARKSERSGGGGYGGGGGYERREREMFTATIAQTLGVSTHTAFTDVRRALRETLQEPADAVRSMELARLDALLRAVWRRATGGHLEAIASALRIMERRAVMLGLDAPRRIDVTGYIREMAEREGLDPGRAVRDAEAIIRREGL